MTSASDHQGLDETMDVDSDYASPANNQPEDDAMEADEPSSAKIQPKSNTMDIYDLFFGFMKHGFIRCRFCRYVAHIYPSTFGSLNHFLLIDS